MNYYKVCDDIRRQSEFILFSFRLDRAQRKCECGALR